MVSDLGLWLLFVYAARSQPDMPAELREVEYPDNITLEDITYFMVAPTLCYQVSRATGAVLLAVSEMADLAPMLEEVWIRGLHLANCLTVVHYMAEVQVGAGISVLVTRTSFALIHVFEPASRIDIVQVWWLQLGYPRSEPLRKGWVLRQSLKLLVFLGLMGFIIEQVCRWCTLQE